MSQANSSCLQLPSKKATQGAVVFWLQRTFFSANTWISFYLHFGAVQRIVKSANLSKPSFPSLVKEYIYTRCSLIQSFPYQVRRQMCSANGIQVNTGHGFAQHTDTTWFESCCLCCDICTLLPEAAGDSKVSQVGSSQQVSARASSSAPQTQPQPCNSAIAKDVSSFWCL